MPATSDYYTIISGTSNALNILSNDYASTEFNATYFVATHQGFDFMGKAGDLLVQIAMYGGQQSSQHYWSGAEWALSASGSVSSLNNYNVSGALTSDSGYSLNFSLSSSGLMSFTDNKGTDLTINGSTYEGSVALDMTGDFSYIDPVSIKLVNYDTAGNSLINGQPATNVAYAISDADSTYGSVAVDTTLQYLSYTPGANFYGVDYIDYSAIRATSPTSLSETNSTVVLYVGDEANMFQTSSAYFSTVTTGIYLSDDSYALMAYNNLYDVVQMNFTDQSLSLIDLQGLIDTEDNVRDLFYEMQSDGNGGYDQVYVMPELFLFPGNPEMEALYDYSYVMPTDNTVGDIIVGSSGNDFINGMGGGDGIIAGDGNDVIDGGLGSNFLTGGNGDDVFYADGRGAHVAGWTREDDEVWTTVTDFNNGNSQATIWGYIDGTSTYTWEANQGAAGWEGITLRADLDGNGVVDTSFTFTGIDNQSELTLATNVVGDLGYILVS